MWRSPRKWGMCRNRRTQDHLNSFTFFQTLRLCSPSNRKYLSEWQMGVMWSAANWSLWRSLSSSNNSSCLDWERWRVLSPSTRAKDCSFPIMGRLEPRTRVSSSSLGQLVPSWVKNGIQSPVVQKLSSNFVKYSNLESDLVSTGSISSVNSQQLQFWTRKVCKFVHWRATNEMRSTEWVVVLSASERNSCDDSLNWLNKSQLVLA